MEGAKLRPILVVEDDRVLRKAVVDCLEDEGYRVYQAGNAEEAAEIAKKSELDLVVTDVRIGKIDGLQFLAQLKRFKPSVKSIVMTGYASDSAPLRAIKAEAEDYLYKPFELDSLLDAVERVLEGDTEEQRYQGLFSRVVSGYRKISDAAGAAIISARLKALERPRDLCFGSFYVGIRSRMLRFQEALQLWEKIERLETQRREALKEGSPSGNTLKSLSGKFQELRDFISAASRTRMPLIRSEQLSCPEPLFRHLFTGIEEGTISREQLKQASFLRSLDNLTLSQSTVLSELRQLVWGEFSD